MTESQTHKLIKNKIAESLVEQGFDVQTELVTKEGRLDVYAIKDGKEVKVEVYKTHIPEWILAKIHGDIDEKPPKDRTKRRQVNLNDKAAEILEKWALSLVPENIPEILREKMKPRYSDTIITINEKLKDKK